MRMRTSSKLNKLRYPVFCACARTIEVAWALLGFLRNFVKLDLETSCTILRMRNKFSNLCMVGSFPDLLCMIIVGRLAIVASGITP